MKSLSYTAAQTTTKNKAYLRHLSFSQLDPTSNALLVEARIEIGYDDGATFVVIETVALSRTASAAQISGFFGASLQDVATKVMQYAQNQGLLPAGTIS